MLALWSALAVINVMALGWISWKLNDLLAYAQDTSTEVSETKAFFRSRISRASMQSGETSPERELTRLGRATAARRVVVGGDPDSQLHTDLTKTDSSGPSRQGSGRVNRRGGGEDG